MFGFILKFKNIVRRHCVGDGELPIHLHAVLDVRHADQRHAAAGGHDEPGAGGQLVAADALLLTTGHHFPDRLGRRANRPPLPHPRPHRQCARPHRTHRH